MAMIRCSKCGSAVSDQIKNCPVCGLPVRMSMSQTMQPQYNYKYQSQYQPPYPQQYQSQYQPPYPQQYQSQYQPPYPQQLQQPINTKKKDSTLSIISAVMSGVASIFPMIIFIGYTIALAGAIIGIIDLALNDKTKKHGGAVFSIVVLIIYSIIVFT